MATQVSQQTFHVAGILTTVYGISEAQQCSEVSCLWLLHPRLQTKDSMTPLASTIVTACHGLIAVAFDQRNHGTREVAKLSNEAWKQGNKNHAQDMFGIFHGTAMDVSLLMDHLGSYLSFNIKEHFSLGISLGGHSSWQCFFHEPRITASIVIIGCPDYMRESRCPSRAILIDFRQAS